MAETRSALQVVCSGRLCRVSGAQSGTKRGLGFGWRGMRGWGGGVEPGGSPAKANFRVGSTQEQTGHSNPHRKVAGGGWAEQAAGNVDWRKRRAPVAFVLAAEAPVLPSRVEEERAKFGKSAGEAAGPDLA